MKIVCLFVLAILARRAEALVPKSAFTFDFNVSTPRMSRSKEHKIYQAVEVLKAVVKSEEFRQKILRHRYLGRTTFVKNRGLSNAQVYARILSGVETLRPYRNNTMDLEVELYTDMNSTVIGYTNPWTPKVFVNKKYFDRFSAGRVAANLMHEWLHKQGYDHEVEDTADRPYTVPYGIGRIVEDLALRYERYGFVD